MQRPRGRAAEQRYAGENRQRCAHGYGAAIRDCALDNRSSTGCGGMGDRLPPQRAKRLFVPKSVHVS
jgi:hypothetical protein